MASPMTLAVEAGVTVASPSKETRIGRKASSGMGASAGTTIRSGMAIGAKAGNTGAMFNGPPGPIGRGLPSGPPVDTLPSAKIAMPSAIDMMSIPCTSPAVAAT